MTAFDRKGPPKPAERKRLFTRPAVILVEEDPFRPGVRTERDAQAGGAQVTTVPPETAPVAATEPAPTTPLPEPELATVRMDPRAVLTPDAAVEPTPEPERVIAVPETHVVKFPTQVVPAERTPSVVTPIRHDAEAERVRRETAEREEIQGQYGIVQAQITDAQNRVRQFSQGNFLVRLWNRGELNRAQSDLNSATRRRELLVQRNAWLVAPQPRAAEVASPQPSEQDPYRPITGSERQTYRSLIEMKDRIERKKTLIRNMRTLKRSEQELKYENDILTGMEANYKTLSNANPDLIARMEAAEAQRQTSRRKAA